MNSLAIPPRPASTQPPCLTIRLLGDFALTYDSKPITVVNTLRLQALLTYLLLHRQAPQSRRHLAFLFWPDSTEAQALTNLRKQLLYLRQTLPNCDALLVMDRHQVQWTPDAAITLDVETFRSALTTAAQATDSQAIAALRRAVTCYTGELLPGCYDDWIFAEREALHTQYGQALERLSSLLETERTYTEAIPYSEQLLRYDPLHEPTYRRLMRLHALNGDRPAALRVYHTCLTQLREELGVDPDEETQAVYERLLHGTTVTTAQPELAAYAPFVSRQVEWQTLQQRWRLAQRGQPQLVLIAGEAGIGKTRLAEELLHWATHQGFCTARARCYAAEGRLTYAPVIEWLRTERLRTARSNVETTWLTELARLLPEILQEAPTVRPPEPITQSWQRHHLFETVSRALLAVDQPLLLLIDDLQWCDKETLELLHFLLRHAATHGQSHLLLVGTARLPDEVATTHPLYELLNPLRGSETLTQLDLARLTEAETTALARQMVDRPLEHFTVQQLFRDTAGNPLFVVETLRATQGQFTANGESDHATPATTLSIEAGEAIVQHLPPKVLAVIQTRLGHLSSTARELCEWAAIVGRAFTLDLLICASKIAPNKAVSALDELWQRRIIREQGSDAYDFSHDRIRDVAAAGVSRVRRRYLHRCVAEALEEQSAEPLNNLFALIAAHYDAAGFTEKATQYYQQAAETNLHIYANHEAVEFLYRALTLLKQLPASSVRSECEYRLLIMLGPPLVALQGYGSEQIRAHYLAAHRLAEQLNCPVDPAILRILAIGYLTHRKFDLAYKFGIELLKSSQSDKQIIDPFLYVESCYTLGVTTFWQGNFQPSRQYLEQGVAAYQQENHSAHVARHGQDPGVICLCRLAWVLWYLGYPKQAFQCSQQSITLATLLQHPFSLDYALLIKQWLAYDARNQKAIEEVVEQLKVHQRRFELSAAAQAFSLVSDGDTLVKRGSHSEGVALIRSGIAVALATNYDLMYKSHFQAILAQAMVSIGDFVQAHQAIDIAIAHADTYGDNFYLAELYRLKGEIALADGQPSVVGEGSFQQALAIARRQQAKSLELRAAMSLARLWDQQGKRKPAGELLAEVYNWFTEGFDSTDLQEAKALLTGLQN